ncbi:hypothetical protein [Roseivirga pacifica]|uniref:hypothetical protein n=1 Tax=Roseivirga pacifica TaxID=1267423 RepID=UPI002095C3C8|nr:hypothetical protein [Roseivirga pacifica]MCO6357138.1 hypothetical protein [Roseivirga pacifica]MCO6368149.1 hypothetical protein [Roseivirga pacifica]MCO6369370.1 hypothetical protein [Roseivirga pacifica]MCO6373224.1 hypothetical protein [Roseivirga pacifica]MCO6377519.1 hypothetical protein [Roseivirga pacifica]
MKIQLINTNYIFDHKLFKLWKFPVLFYGVLLIFKTAGRLNELQNHESLIEIISSTIIYSGILLFFFNVLMYSKIGELIIEGNSIIAKKYNGKEQPIDLHSLKSIRMGNDKGNFYSLQIGDREFEVIFSKNELIEFKQYLTQKNIEIKDKYWYERVRKWFALRKNGT